MGDVQRDLLVQATASLLGDWTGPVVVRFGGKPANDADLVSGVLVETRDFDARVLMHGTHFERVPLEALYIDLSRAECRSLCALRLHKRNKHTPDVSVPGWRLIRTGGGTLAWGFDAKTCWPVTWGEKRRSTVAFSTGYRGSMGFQGLDPADPSRLGDGTRWVDAAALRRVVDAYLGNGTTYADLLTAMSSGPYWTDRFREALDRIATDADQDGTARKLVEEALGLREVTRG